MLSCVAGRKVNVLWIKCFGTLVGAGIERELTCGVEQRVLRWFAQVERMDEYRMARRVLI